jgi:hypothetical protein
MKPVQTRQDPQQSIILRSSISTISKQGQGSRGTPGFIQQRTLRNVLYTSPREPYIVSPPVRHLPPMAQPTALARCASRSKLAPSLGFFLICKMQGLE